MPEMESSLEAFRAKVKELSERFIRQEARYRSPAYNEETARSEFVSPFFEALGWDVSNRQGHALQYRDVIHEEGIRVGDATKAPDYTFRIGGQRKFFVEAKKPGVDLKNQASPAYQLRRYAWSAKLPLSLLTDFEELAVYDSRIKPKESDKASVARVFYFDHRGYSERAEEIWKIFSKRAVLEGSFDSYAEDSRRKRGTSEVDAEFLKEIESWREELAKNLALRNDLKVDELNYAVQATIDRILFLRIAEGRGAELYGRLLALTNGQNTYRRLAELFQDADDRYNSGIFDFRTDKLTLKLKLDDKVLRPILAGLYYPESPYEFSVLPAEILGNVYEQFLGKVIRLTEGGRARVEEKPEVKKAGGVYYTPTYIVDFIVAQTVGTWTGGKSPKEMAKLRVVDPACGSGSFLLAAYQKLMDAYLGWYRDHEPRKHKEAVFEGPGGDWRLTTAEKRRILLSSIYGVDIDRQAVEVTKLSLLLKCLEGETNESLSQITLFGDKALPSLEKNIQCGNSLISSQVLRRYLGGLFPDKAEQSRINPFDWQISFPEVFKAGGFDAVIGNPPYAYRNATEEVLRPAYAELFRSAEGNLDLYKFFIEKGIELAREGGGLLGMIVSATFLVQPTFRKLRELLLKSTTLELLVPLGPGAFENATVDTVVIVARRQVAGTRHQVSIVTPDKPRDLPSSPSVQVSQSRFATNQGQTFDYRLSDEGAKLFGRLVSDFSLLEVGFEIGVGINTGYIKGELVADRKLDKRYHPMVPGSGISRYGSVESKGWIMYDTEFVRDRGKMGRSLPPERFFSSDKLLVVRTRNLSLKKRIVATLDRRRCYNLNRLSNIIARPGRSLLGLLAILNSRLMDWMFATRYFDYEIKPVYLRSAPVADTEVKLLAELAERALSLSKELEAVRTEFERQSLVRQFTAVDAEIDQLVFGLYKLTAEEIALVGRM